MWKVIIADDEPKSRRGLQNLINWNELNMEVVGEAEDGEIALQIAGELKPDIMIVDICMPFVNGLELIEKLKAVLPYCIMIVVSGHDEFAYAQQALRLNVFDYILKPVPKDQFYGILHKAVEALEDALNRDKYMNWAQQQLDKNLPYLREGFLRDLLAGKLTDIEIEEQLYFFNIAFNQKSGMIVIKIVEKLTKEQFLAEKDRHIVHLAVESIVAEMLQTWQPNLIFKDNKDNIIAILTIADKTAWTNLGENIQKAVDQYLKITVIVSQEKLENCVMDIPVIYEKLLEDINKKADYTPVVFLAKKYLDTYYYKEDLSLQEVADELQISPTYLSRLLKQEIGVSFVEYLTQVRVRKAIQLMSDPALKIYEIAERVGYNSQHYFCNAFKKVLEVSPAEYRRGGQRC